MSRSTAFTLSVIKNAAHTCSLSSCGQPRSGVDLWCRAHIERGKRYGHPLARPLPPGRWSRERSMVRDLFAKNPTHQGQVQALELIRLWMAQATSSESAYRGAEEVARLARHGVAPIDILTELCAVSMFLADNPRVVFDQRSHDFAISGAIFKLSPRPRRITRKPGMTLAAKGTSSYAPKPRSSAMAYVGRHLRVTLAGLIANVITSLASREERRRTFEEALTAPFSTL